MLIHVLLYQSGKDDEGIHSLEVNNKTIVLMFEEKDDAERYVGLLEAQDFPKPTIEKVERSEIEIFCEQAGYESRFVESGFIPTSQEERLLISPPESNLDVSSWNGSEYSNDKKEITSISPENKDQLDSFRQRLEDMM
tara:strand:+ start:674 stop:1087 length:414 start_codon:yes stop_codon:yes gene_type:complete